MARIATSTATWAAVFITNDHILLLCDLRTLVPNSPDICLKFPQNPTHMTWKEVHKRFLYQHQKEFTQPGLVPHVDADNSRIQTMVIYSFYTFFNKTIQILLFHSRSTLVTPPPPKNKQTKQTVNPCMLHPFIYFLHLQIIRQITTHSWYQQVL